MPDARSPSRRALETWSRPLLLRLSSAPRWAVGLGLGVVLLGGLFAPSPIGPLLLGVVVLFLGWLVALSWPQLPPGSRTVRTLVVLVLAAVVVARAAGLL